jgi:glucose-1-phosphate cytidylyltransferase
MKAVILAGGLGTRLSEETIVRPKPMVEIGGKPILWHVMKIYSAHGINDFVVCLGYRGYVIKEYFANYFLHSSDVTFDMKENRMHIHKADVEPWKVTLVETEPETQTGGRIKRVLSYVSDDDAFCLTYGDGVGNVDVNKTIAQHRASGVLATVMGTQAPGRFGALRHEAERVTGFQEKLLGDGEEKKQEWDAGNRHEAIWHPLRIHRASQRYMVKQFIADFWRQWHLQDGLPVVPTYHEAKQGGHTSNSEAAE